jgi:ATP-binding protein involved in chromosome partitioning
MSWFVCPHCGERTSIFGQGGGAEAADTLGVPLVGQIPIEPHLRQGGDEGSPIVVREPDSPAARALVEAAERVAQVTRSRVGKPLTLFASGTPAAAAAGHHH